MASRWNARGEPLFTVIVPVYNVAPFLEKSLLSLLEQAGEDVQVLLVDDGSTDESGALCDAYAPRFPWGEALHQQNSGVAAARNAGLRRARGEYLLWLDPDDWVLPGWMQGIREEIEAHRPDMLIFDYAKCYGRQQQVCLYGRPAGRLSAGQVLLDLTEDHRLTSVLWNKVIHRRFFAARAFDETLRCLEDYDLLYRMVMEMENIRYRPGVLYAYRIRDDGLVRAPDLNIGYQSFQQAQMRYKAVRSAGKEASVLGTVLQAKGFCCKYYQSGMPGAYKAQYRACCRHLRRSLRAVIRAEGLGLKDKMKYALIPWRGVGLCYALAKKLKRK